MVRLSRKSKSIGNYKKKQKTKTKKQKHIEDTNLLNGNIDEIPKK